MKRFLPLLLVFLLFSCSNSETKEVWVIDETKQIISDYPDTLELSLKDAKKVKEQYDENNSNLEKQLKDAKQ